MTEQNLIENCWEDRTFLQDSETLKAIRNTVEEVDKGRIRVAEPLLEGGWKVNEWVKKAIILYFPIQQMSVSEVGIFEYHDKMKL